MQRGFSIDLDRTDATISLNHCQLPALHIYPVNTIGTADAFI